jgi:hypothetical protein
MSIDLKPAPARVRARVPRRDLIVLPLVLVGTMLVLLAGGEVTARIAFPQVDDVEPCELHTPDGSRYRPDCTSRTKVWEGPWVTQHFNDCGYRTAESCAARPPGALRVVVVGSSTARGALVNYPDSFAAIVSADLTRQCGGRVDVQNLGTEPVDVDRIDRRMPEARALRPAAIVMTIGPYDLIHLKDPPPAADPEPERIDLRWFVGRLRESRLFLMVQYQLYRDPAFQVRAFLLNGDAADYVRDPLTPLWRQRVADLGDLLGRITAQAGTVPVLLVYIPERAQAALAAMRADPPGVDPYVLPKALAATAAAHGVTLLDATKAFAAAPDFQSLFYLTDGHPREGGHAALAGAIDTALRREPAFAACTRS